MKIKSYVVTIFLTKNTSIQKIELNNQVYFYSTLKHIIVLYYSTFLIIFETKQINEQ